MQNCLCAQHEGLQSSTSTAVLLIILGII